MTICSTSEQRSQVDGTGLLELSFVNGRTVATRCFATNPLKILVPRRDNPAAWAYVSSYGGGMVSGDQIDLNVVLHPGATCVLGTQASTKIYRDQNQRGCHQTVSARLAAGSMLIAVPDPVTCFRDAVFEQQQSYYLKDDASMVLVDWVTSGRRDAGEIWDFQRYRSRIDLYHNTQLTFSDTMLLDVQDGPIASAYRLGRFHCLATVVLAGPGVEQAGERILADLSKEATAPGSSVIESVSPFDNGFVLRMLGMTTEKTSNRLKHRLVFLKTLLNETPWERKW